MIAVWIHFFFIRPALADVPSKAPPETVIEMSLGDLVSAKKRTAPRLPRDYAAKVARILMEARPDLTACYHADKSGAASWMVELLISDSGQGKLEPMGTTELATDDQTCVRKILSHLSYPPHTLPGPVMVKLPLKFKKEML